MSVRAKNKFCKIANSKLLFEGYTLITVLVN